MIILKNYQEQYVPLFAHTVPEERRRIA